MGSTHLSLVRSAALADSRDLLDTPQRVRIVDGALRCIERQGIAKTTLDDIAREAGYSRATVYRVFPGGKENVLGAVVDTELARFYSALAVRLGDAGTLEEVLVVGIAEGAAMIARHRALGYLLEHEPGAVLPSLTFGGLDRLLLVAGDLAAPLFARWLEPEQASRAAEWAVRIVMTYCANPASDTDLCDAEDARALVHAFVLPGILALRADVAGARPRAGRAFGA